MMSASPVREVQGLAKQISLGAHWGNEVVLPGFASMRASEQLLDARLVCAGGAVLRAHTSLLAVASPIFKAAFLTHLQLCPSQPPVVLLPLRSERVVTALLDLVYNGRVSNLRGEEDYSELLQLTTELQMPAGIKAKITQLLQNVGAPPASPVANADGGETPSDKEGLTGSSSSNPSKSPPGSPDSLDQSPQVSDHDESNVNSPNHQNPPPPDLSESPLTPAAQTMSTSQQNVLNSDIVKSNRPDAQPAVNHQPRTRKIKPDIDAPDSCMDCDFCKKRFTEKKELEEHILQAHCRHKTHSKTKGQTTTVLNSKLRELLSKGTQRNSAQQEGLATSSDRSAVQQLFMDHCYVKTQATTPLQQSSQVERDVKPKKRVALSLNADTTPLKLRVVKKEPKASGEWVAPHMMTRGMTRTLKSIKCELEPLRKMHCRYCDFFTSYKAVMNHHEKRKHNYPCSKCKKIYQTRALMCQHYRRTHNFSYKCATCHFKFSTWNNLNSHVSEVHIPRQLNNGNSNKETQSNNNKSRSNNNKSRSSSSNNQSQNKNLKMKSPNTGKVATPNKIHKCPHCTYSVQKDSTRLQYHIIDNHLNGNIARYFCPCGAGFATNNSRASHCKGCRKL